MKNYQFFLIIALLYDILSNQNTGYRSDIDSVLSCFNILASIYYMFKPEGNTIDIQDITVNVKDIKHNKI